MRYKVDPTKFTTVLTSCGRFDLLGETVTSFTRHFDVDRILIAEDSEDPVRRAPSLRQHREETGGTQEKHADHPEHRREGRRRPRALEGRRRGRGGGLGFLFGAYFHLRLSTMRTVKKRNSAVVDR